MEAAEAGAEAGQEGAVVGEEGLAYAYRYIPRSVLGDYTTEVSCVWGRVGAWGKGWARG